MPIDGEITSLEQSGMKDKPRWRDRLIPAATISLVVALSAALFIFRNSLAVLGSLGYIGLFVISLAFNASIFLPMPIFPVVAVMGLAFNPVLVGLAAAAGGAFGELSGYAAGFSGRGILSGNPSYERAKSMMRKWGAAGIFLFSVVPLLPFDLAGMAAGALHFPVWKFLLVSFLGKAILYTIVAFGGVVGWQAVMRLFGA